MKILICPKCRSKDVYYEAGGTYDKRGKYVCKRCGFSAVVFPEFDLKE